MTDDNKHINRRDALKRIAKGIYGVLGAGVMPVSAFSKETNKCSVEEEMQNYVNYASYNSLAQNNDGKKKYHSIAYQSYVSYSNYSNYMNWH